MSTLISVSGGMDSVTLLGMLLHNKVDTVNVVHFMYGSKHQVEEEKAVRNVIAHYGDQIDSFNVVDMRNLFEQLQVKSNLLQTGEAIPEGHYQEESMRQTVVPGRNTLFVACMLSICQSHELDVIALGIHSGDHFIYPDCRPDWFAGMRQTVLIASGMAVDLRAPFLQGDKTSIIKMGLQLGVPYHLTRTCYTNQPIACGKCGSCQERLEAFANNGVDDPLPYETRELMPKGN